MNYFDRWFLNLQNHKVSPKYTATLDSNNPLILHCVLEATINHQPIQLTRTCTVDTHLITKDILMGELLKNAPQPLPFTE